MTGCCYCPACWESIMGGAETGAYVVKPRASAAEAGGVAT